MALINSCTLLCLFAFLHIHAQESSMPNGVNTSDFNMNGLMNLTTGQTLAPQAYSHHDSHHSESTTSQPPVQESSSQQPSSESPLEPSEATSESLSETTPSSSFTTEAAQSDMAYSTLYSTVMGEDVLNSTYPTYSGYDDVHSLNGSLFSCYGRSFGQYADVSKECHIFHLCYPFVNLTTGNLIYQRISFLCDADSVFDQRLFVCVDNSTLSYGCGDAPSYYQSSNLNYLSKILTDIVNGSGNQESGENAIDGESVHSHEAQGMSKLWPWNMFH